MIREIGNPVKDNRKRTYTFKVNFSGLLRYFKKKYI